MQFSGDAFSIFIQSMVCIHGDILTWSTMGIDSLLELAANGHLGYCFLFFKPEVVACS